MIIPLNQTVYRLYKKHLFGRFRYQHAPHPLTLPSSYYQTTLMRTAPLPRLSIVTPSLNQGHFIEQTVQSVFNQHYTELEYILQDGMSSDDTLAVLEKHRSKFSHFTSEKDTGQSNAINRGFSQATGEIMAWLNADDLLLPGTLAYVVNYFLAHPDVDVLYGHRIHIDENGHEIGRWLLPPHDNHMLYWIDHIPQETLFWRRSLWEKVGGYIDETYQFAMDWELLMRFQKAGAKFVRLPRFLGAFRVHAGQKTLALNKLGQQEMARLRQTHHGRDVSWLETKWTTKLYLTRLVWLNLRHRWGLITLRDM